MRDDRIQACLPLAVTVIQGRSSAPTQKIVSPQATHDGRDIIGHHMPGQLETKLLLLEHVHGRIGRVPGDRIELEPDIVEAALPSQSSRLMPGLGEFQAITRLQAQTT